MIDQVTARFIRRTIVGLLLAGLIALGYFVLQPFLIPVAWAMIIAYTSWPIYSFLYRSLKVNATLSALLMTMLITTAFILPTLWVISLLRHEIGTVYTHINSLITQGPPALPDYIKTLPWLGDWLNGLITQSSQEPDLVQNKVALWLQESSNQMISLLGDVGRNAAKVGFTLITLFFLFRDGEQLFSQVHRVLFRFLGERVNNYLIAVGKMTTAVVWGLIITALAQGVVAGIGYWWLGLSAPMLLGTITALVAMVPFGAPFAWGGIALFLLIGGQYLNGIILLAWGALAVSSVDNLVRPIVISNASQIPFLLVMFGVLGGLAAFGLVGLFMGPVILAVLIAIWQEWLEESEQEQSDQKNQSANSE